jgi:hypothetical protein
LEIMKTIASGVRLYFLGEALRAAHASQQVRACKVSMDKDPFLH